MCPLLLRHSNWFRYISVQMEIVINMFVPEGKPLNIKTPRNMGQIFNLHEAHVCRHGTKSALGVSDYEAARLSASLRHSVTQRRHQPPCKKAPCTALRRAQFFPQLAVGVTWWLLLLYTPHREWWYYSLKRVGGAVGKWCMGRASSIILSLVVVNRRYYNLCYVCIWERERAIKREDLLCLLYARRGWMKTPRAVGIEVASTIILSLLDDNVQCVTLQWWVSRIRPTDIKLDVQQNFKI